MKGFVFCFLFCYEQIVEVTVLNSSGTTVHHHVHNTTAMYLLNVLMFLMKVI